MTNEQTIREFEKKLKQRLRTLPRAIGNEMLNFSLDRFKAQAWIAPWPKRKAKTAWGPTPRNEGRALLIDKGRLRRSLRLAKADWEAIGISSNDPRAKVHNDGFRGTVRQSVKMHVRKFSGRDQRGVVGGKTFKTKSRVKYGQTASGISFVKQHTRTIKQNIPRRRFLGDHPLLMRRLKYAGEMHLKKNL